MNEATEQLVDYLVKIANKSHGGEIPWSQSNPSTFQWAQDADGKMFLVTIQKAESPKPKNFLSLESDDEANYLFQVIDRRFKQTMISLSSKERPEVHNILREIYRGAEIGMDVRASDVLKKLLGD